MIAGISRTKGDVIAEIKMSSTAFSGCFLLVEGPSDSRFVSPRIAKSQCEIVVCGSKSVVIDSAMEANRGLTKALGLIDDDFDSILGISYDTSHLVPTDTHDVETLLLSSPALDKTVSEYANQDMLRRLEDDERTNFSVSLLKRALPFGRYRLINAVHGFNVSFIERFSPWKYIDCRNWALDTDRLENEFAKASNLDVLTLRGLTQALPQAPSPWNLVQGHDVIAILLIAFRGVLGVKTRCSEENLCSALRLAFDEVAFQKTRLHANVKFWEARSGANVLSS